MKAARRRWCSVCCRHMRFWEQLRTTTGDRYCGRCGNRLIIIWEKNP